MPDSPTSDAPVGFDTVEAYLRIPRLTSLVLSPDGSRLVAGVQTRSREGKEMVGALWEVDPQGSAPARRLTEPAKGLGEPGFTPAGDVLFRAKRAAAGETDDDATQGVWLLPSGGGEARRVASRPGGISSYAVGRDSGRLAVLSPTLPGTHGAEDDAAARAARKDLGVTAILHEGVPVRYWDHDLGPEQIRLLVAGDPAAADRADDEVALRDLTPEPDHALDVDPGLAVSPDGATAVVTWGLQDRVGLRFTRLVAFDTATGERRVVAEEPFVFYESPVFSRDGRRLAAVRTADSTYDDPPVVGLWVLDLASGEGRVVASGWDSWPGEIAFSADGEALFVAADENGRRPVFRVDLADDTVTRVAAGAHFTSLCVAPDGVTLYALRDGVDHPPTPVRLSAAGVDQPGEPLRCFDPVRVPGTVEDVTTVVADGTTVRGWLVTPDAAGPHPLVLWVHGGPLSSWNAWSWRWNPWLLAAHGYALLLPDPALSTGYGQEMLRRGWGQWGGAPYDDVMALTDSVVARPDIDAERTAMMGGSYGGYMANWIAGHTDRFRAIVTHASLWALEQFGPTTDAPAFWEREFGDPADPAQDRWRTWSPHQFVDRIVTPMLVIHGDKDYRVPLGEGLRLWWDLQKRGVTSAFLYFPDENHWVLSPGGATVWYETVLAWLATHVLGEKWQRPGLLA